MSLREVRKILLEYTRNNGTKDFVGDYEWSIMCSILYEIPFTDLGDHDKKTLIDIFK